MGKWDSRTNRPRILFDMDDVISDFVGYLLTCYNARTIIVGLNAPPLPAGIYPILILQ